MSENCGNNVQKGNCDLSQPHKSDALNAEAERRAITGLAACFEFLLQFLFYFWFVLITFSNYSID